MEATEQFLRDLGAVRRLSPRTVTTYGVTLRLWRQHLAALGEPLTPLEADSDVIRDWLALLMESGHSATYVCRTLSTLRTFYRYCLTEGLLSRDPAHAVSGPKRPQRLPHFVREGDMERLLESLDRLEPTYNNVRTRTIIYLLYHTGLRAAELLSLDDESIDLATDTLRVTGKRNKQRTIPFGEELHRVVAEYQTRRDGSVARRDKGALLLTERGRRLTYGRLRRDVSDTLALVTTDTHRSPHVLRHTFATAMLNNHASLESIRQLLGHQSLDTTEIYTHTTFEQLRQVYNEAHPRA